jgi:hypothetical protein
MRHFVFIESTNNWLIDKEHCQFEIDTLSRQFKQQQGQRSSRVSGCA